MCVLRAARRSSTCDISTRGIGCSHAVLLTGRVFHREFAFGRMPALPQRARAPPTADGDEDEREYEYVTQSGKKTTSSASDAGKAASSASSEVTKDLAPD